MLPLANYSINHQIYTSPNSLVYRGISKEDNHPVILKVLRENYPTPIELTRYKQEYRLTNQLNIPGVIKAERLIEYGNSYIIIFEDFGGESLKQLYSQQSFSLLKTLEITLKIVNSLGYIHQAGIIHKDINPANIVYNPRKQQLKIIDFGIATQLHKENLTLKNPSLLEGTLAYISPEQTGRMNRQLDYRSDFYSLGVTFYQLLTGNLPFITKDPLELLHAHLAKNPAPLIRENISTTEEKIVAICEQIIEKLMAKTAEQRYQTPVGIQTDLEYCITQLKNNSQSVSFQIGQSDQSDRFFIPEKLYGREKEAHQLLNAFNSTIEKAASQFILVSGYSGIGKSALVKELYKPVTKAKGYFISGKFDQYQRNIPYSAITLAFQDLIKQILCESDKKLQQWKEKLVTALGKNAQLIIDIIPEVELIIGQQKKIEGLSGIEAKNRLNCVFRKFIKVIATK
ncbi:MAG: AAA family ATPase [Crocosphaera sp.]